MKENNCHLPNNKQHFNQVKKGQHFVKGLDLGGKESFKENRIKKIMDNFDMMPQQNRNAQNDIQKAQKPSNLFSNNAHFQQASNRLFFDSDNMFNKPQSETEKPENLFGNNPGSLFSNNLTKTVSTESLTTNLFSNNGPKAEMLESKTTNLFSPKTNLFSSNNENKDLKESETKTTKETDLFNNNQKVQEFLQNKESNGSKQDFQDLHDDPLADDNEKHSDCEKSDTEPL